MSFLVVLLTLCDAPVGKAQDDEANKQAADSNLDRELLGELEEDLDEIDAPKTGRPAKKADAKPSKSIDEELLEDLELEGEDIELGPDGEPTDELGAETHPLTHIGAKMRQVEERFSRQDLTDQTQQLQDDIVKDLDEFIKQLLQQMKKQQSQAGSSQQKKQQQASRSKIKLPTRSPQPTPGNRESTKPATDSEDRLGQPKRPKVDMDELSRRLEEYWRVNLPEKEREVMRQLSVEEFLPKYELLIEKYFRRLTEESQENR